MKFCYNCGAKIEEGDKFCVDCGAELSLAFVEEEVKDSSEEAHLKTEEEAQRKVAVEDEIRRKDLENYVQELQENRNEQCQYESQESIQKASHIVIAPPVEEESVIKEKKSHTSRNVLIFLLVCIAAIGGFVAYGYFSSGHKTGYETIEAAAEKDIELIGQGKEADLFNEITSEEWNVVFNHYKTQLKRVSITSVGELKKAVKEKAVGYHYRQDIRPRNLYIKHTITPVKKSLSYLPYYVQDLGYDPGIVEIGFTDERGLTREAYLYYYNKGEKYYSALCLEALDELTEEVAYQGKNKDIEAAERIGTSVQASLANEDAYDDAREFFDSGRVVAVAFGENAFVSNVEKPLNSFLKELNENLGGTAPEPKYEGPVNGWKPAGWAVVLYDKKPFVQVYITDGTTNNMVEIYPNVDANYNVSENAESNKTTETIKATETVETTEDTEPTETTETEDPNARVEIPVDDLPKYFAGNPTLNEIALIIRALDNVNICFEQGQDGIHSKGSKPTGQEMFDYMFAAIEWGEIPDLSYRDGGSESTYGGRYRICSYDEVKTLFLSVFEPDEFDKYAASKAKSNYRGEISKNKDIFTIWQGGENTEYLNYMPYKAYKEGNTYYIEAGNVTVIGHMRDDGTLKLEYYESSFSTF